MVGSSEQRLDPLFLAEKLFMQTKAYLERQHVKQIKAELLQMKQRWGAPIPPFQREATLNSLKGNGLRCDVHHYGRSLGRETKPLTQAEHRTEDPEVRE